jgi:K+-sensing histidine kinase KdpD
LKYPRSIFRKTPSSLAFHEQRSQKLRYVWAVTLVALGLLIGFIFEPAFGRSQAYATFYPVVLLAAYTLGPRPAVVATVLSAAVAYWCLVPPDFQWKWDTQVGAALAFFLGTSTAGIYLISRLLRSDRNRHRNPAAVARVNAMIFADLAARAAPASRRAYATAPRLAPAGPSYRSFDVARGDREADQAGSDRSSASKQEVLATDEHATTIH